jgi:hypothetical protein
MLEQYPQHADLFIIRARLYYKDKTKVFIRILLFSFSRLDMAILTRKTELGYFEWLVQSLEQHSEHR